MGVTAYSLPYGLRDCRLFPLDASFARGAGVDLPASRTFTFKDTEDFSELNGDDKIIAAHGNGPTVDWELEGGGISIAAYKIIAGGASVLTGVTPNEKLTFTKLTTDQRPYFEVEGQAISDSGGDLHAIVYRCKATGDLEGAFDNGNFYLTKAKGKGYGRLDNFKLYDFVQNESVSAIP